MNGRVAVRLSFLVLALFVVGAAAQAGEGSLFVGSGTTESKPQSKLWHHDGSWWAVLLDGADHLIYRLEGDEFVPVPNGFVDSHNSAQADVVSTGDRLLVLMCYRSGSQFYEFTYDALSRTYQLESGFPVALPLGDGWADANLALDTTGKAWITYRDGDDVRVIWTTSADHRSWDTGGLTIESGVLTDDLASIVAFDGKIGVLWSNQVAGEFGFRVHVDGDSVTDWAPIETVISGGSSADDHINLASTPDGRVLAATKDGRDQINLFLRTTGGTWEGPHQVAPDGTRPIVVYDEDNDEAYVFYTNWSGVDRKIVYQRAPVDSLATIGSVPETDLLVAPGSDVNNVTSTKQTAGDATGVLAAAKANDGYVYFKGLAFSLPTAAPSASVTQGIAPLTVQFTGDGSDPNGFVVSYAWDFGDGQTSTQQNPAHTYTDPGVYAATLTVTDDEGNTGRDTVAIVATSPDAPVPGGALASINFQPASAPVPPGYAPDNGAAYDAARGYGWNASVSTNARGVNPDARLDTFAYVDNTTSADWEYALPNGQYFVTVVAGSPRWSGIHHVALEGVTVIDGVTTGSGEFVEAREQLIAVADGRLTVTIGGSGGAKKTKLCYVLIESAEESGGNLPPSATATPSVTSGEAPLPVDFTGSGSDPDGTIVSYDWDFGDGTTSTAQNPSHTYTAAGTYGGRLTVTDDGGRTASDTFTITVTDGAPPPPPPPPPPGASVIKINFQPAASLPPDGYDVDAGATYSAARGYGWSRPLSVIERDFNPDQRLDTYAYASNSDAAAVWEYALADGQYLVTLVAGSPQWGGIHYVSLEGTMVIDGAVTRVSFVEVTDQLVTVSDGKLTMTIGGSGTSKKTKVCYIIITSLQ